MDAVMQSPIRRTIPFSGGAEITIPSGPHQYSTKTWVGSISRGHTPEQAFEALSWHATPFQRVKSVDGGTVEIPGVGPVRQLVDPDRLTIVNTTLPGHLLHPGNVFRKIVQEGDDLYVVTQGYGTGIFPTVNELGAGSLWSGVDSNVFMKLNPPLKPFEYDYPMDEMNVVANMSKQLPSQFQRPDTAPAELRPEFKTPPPIFFSPR